MQKINKLSPTKLDIDKLKKLLSKDTKYDLKKKITEKISG